MRHTRQSNRSLRARVSLVGPRSSAAYRDRGPGPEVDPVTVAQRDQVSGWYLAAVEQRPVGRAGIEHGPKATRYRKQQRMQAADAGVHGRLGQVYLHLHTAGRAAPPDPHLLAAQREWSFGHTGRKRQV